MLNVLRRTGIIGALKDSLLKAIQQFELSNADEITRTDILETLDSWRFDFEDDCS